MFGGTDTKRLDFLWMDGKKHVVQILEDDEAVDVKILQEQYHKMIEDKEELCKTIYYLGLGLTGSPSAARGFVYGWLVKSIRDSVEKAGRPRWKIEHESTDISEEEAREHVAKELETIAKKIRDDDEYKVKKAPILRGETDGTDLFE
jgi:hypothetical protein